MNKKEFEQKIKNLEKNVIMTEVCTYPKKSDKKKRIEWLNRGIHSNETNCMVDMAGIYLSEDSTLQDIHNPQKGIELYKKAARHGNGKAYFALGNIYNDGEFVSKDDNKAFE